MSAPFVYHANGVVGQIVLAPSPTVSGTDFYVALEHADRFPDPAIIGVYPVTVWPNGEIPSVDNEEIIVITAKDGAKLTGARAGESSTARAIVEGDLVAMTITAGILRDVEDKAVVLGGRSGGQIIKGDTASAGALTLQSTAHATRGPIYFGGAQLNYFDEAANTWWLGGGADQFGNHAASILNVYHGGPLAFITTMGATVKITRDEHITALGGSLAGDTANNAALHAQTFSQPGNVMQPTAIGASAYGYSQGGLYVLAISASAQQTAGATDGDAKVGGAMAVLAGARSTVVGGSIIGINLEVRNATGVDINSSAMNVAAVDISVGGFAHSGADYDAYGDHRWGSGIQMRTVGAGGDAMLYSIGTWRNGLDFSDAALTISGLDIKGKGNSAFPGWVRVGSTSTPASTTAGDFTATRIFANNDPYFGLAYVTGQALYIFDNNDYLSYTRSNDTLTTVITGAAALTLTASAMTIPSGSGLIAPYGAFGTTPAAAGALRLPTATYITVRNAANSGDLNMVRMNASDLVQFGANVAAFTLGGAITGNSQNITGVATFGASTAAIAGASLNSAVLAVAGGASVSTYLRVGSNSDPTNTTAGDVQSVRAFVTTYARIGSATVPTNATTAGDLTLARLNIGDVAFASAVIAAVGGATVSTYFRAGSNSDPSNVTAGDITAVRIFAANHYGSITNAAGGTLTLAGTTNATKGHVYIQASTIFDMDETTGQLLLPTTGSSAGLLIGGDVQFYRAVADVWATPDSVRIGGYLSIGTTSAPAHTTAGDFTATNVYATVADLATGVRIGGAATAGNVLRGDGTNFISAQPKFGDLAHVTGERTTWTPGYTGFSSNPTVAVATYEKVGGFAIVRYVYSGLGTSNSTAFTITGLPVAAANSAIFFFIGGGADGGGNVTDVYADLTGTTLTLHRGLAGVWIAAAAKGVYNFTLVYEY